MTSDDAQQGSAILRKRRVADALRKLDKMTREAHEESEEELKEQHKAVQSVAHLMHAIEQYHRALERIHHHTDMGTLSKALEQLKEVDQYVSALDDEQISIKYIQKAIKHHMAKHKKLLKRVYEESTKEA